MTADHLDVLTGTLDGATVLTIGGVLDSTTYRGLRDKIIKAALDEPRAVLVDVTDLKVPAESALAVFTSARWHIDRWPGVPILLVCAHRAGRSAIARNGVTRYIAVYASISAALEELARSGPPQLRRRARAQLRASLASLQRSRELVAEWLTAWAHPEMIPVAKVVVTALVENVLQHTDSEPGVRVEFDGSDLTVAVEDADNVPAGLRERVAPPSQPSGLRIVSALTRAWGNAPTTSGKTVWAVIGPENTL